MTARQKVDQIRRDYRAQEENLTGQIKNAQQDATRKISEILDGYWITKANVAGEGPWSTEESAKAVLLAHASGAIDTTVYHDGAEIGYTMFEDGRWKAYWAKEPFGSGMEEIGC